MYSMYYGAKLFKIFAATGIKDLREVFRPVNLWLRFQFEICMNLGISMPQLFLK